MRNLLIILGVALIALGTLVVSGRPTVKTKHNILEVGEFKASVQEERSLAPPWVGVVGIAGGVGMILAGIRKPRA
jgi:hypothetical protein